MSVERWGCLPFVVVDAPPAPRDVCDGYDGVCLDGAFFDGGVLPGGEPGTVPECAGEYQEPVKLCPRVVANPVRVTKCGRMGGHVRVRDPRHAVVSYPDGCQAPGCLRCRRGALKRMAAPVHSWRPPGEGWTCQLWTLTLLEDEEVTAAGGREAPAACAVLLGRARRFLRRMTDSKLVLGGHAVTEATPREWRWEYGRCGCDGDRECPSCGGAGYVWGGHWHVHIVVWCRPVYYGTCHVPRRVWEGPDGRWWAAGPAGLPLLCLPPSATLGPSGMQDVAGRVGVRFGSARVVTPSEAAKYLETVAYTTSVAGHVGEEGPVNAFAARFCDTPEVRAADERAAFVTSLCDDGLASEGERDAAVKLARRRRCQRVDELTGYAVAHARIGLRSSWRFGALYGCAGARVVPGREAEHCKGDVDAPEPAERWLVEAFLARETFARWLDREAPKARREAYAALNADSAGEPSPVEVLGGNTVPSCVQLPGGSAHPGATAPGRAAELRAPVLHGSANGGWPAAMPRVHAGEAWVLRDGDGVAGIAAYGVGGRVFMVRDQKGRQHLPLPGRRSGPWSDVRRVDLGAVKLTCWVVGDDFDAYERRYRRLALVDRATGGTGQPFTPTAHCGGTECSSDVLVTQEAREHGPQVPELE